MSDNEPDFLPAEDLEAAYTVNLKTSGEYDAGMLTVRAMDAEQLKERLAEVTAAEVIPMIIEVEKALQAAERETKKLNKPDPDAGEEKKSSGTRRSTGNRSSGNGNGAKSAPKGDGDVTFHPEGITCEHVDEDGDADCGEVVVKKIIKKGTKTYKLWTCPNQRQRDDGHYSEFIN